MTLQVDVAEDENTGQPLRVGDLVRMKYSMAWHMPLRLPENANERLKLGMVVKLRGGNFCGDNPVSPDLAHPWRNHVIILIPSMGFVEVSQDKWWNSVRWVASL